MSTELPHNNTPLGTIPDFGTVPQTTAALMELLVERLALEEPVPLRPVKLGTPNAKWRALSSLQKAVRRNNVENALKMASALINSGETAHLLKRLCVIAMEDVAFGNPVLCGQMFLFASAVKVRKALGGDEKVLHLVQWLCQATKDRIPCEIAVSAGFSPTDNEHKLWLHSLPHKELIRLATEGHWQDQQTAARLLAGTIKIGDDYLNDHRDLQAFRDLFEDSPTLIQYLAQRAASTGEAAGLVSGMRLGYHLLYNHPDRENLYHLIKGALLTPEEVECNSETVVKGVMLAALDMHTQEGKRAFAKLLKYTEAGVDFGEWVTSLGGDPMQALGNGVFMVEGKVCDKRLWSMDVARIEQVSREAQMGRSCLPGDKLDTLCFKVRELLPALNVIRAEVLQKN